MKRPYIVCHMVSSIDGGVTGEYLSCPECEAATETYYAINREYKGNGSNGFICGRVTMQESFAGEWYPDLSVYESDGELIPSVFLPDEEKMTGFYAVSFDTSGRLGWRSAFIEDYDPGYDKAQIVEILTEQADSRFLKYLMDVGIPYIIAGKKEIDVSKALEILYTHMGIKLLLLEGGSIVNGYFLRAGCVDEISLVEAPLIAGKESKPIFSECGVYDFVLSDVQIRDSVPVKKYNRK